MRKQAITTASILVLSLTLAIPLVASPLIELGNQADAIVLAKLQSMAADGNGGIDVRLQPTVTIKGGLPTLTISAQLPPSALMAQNRSRPIQGPVGASGLWFLKEVSSGSYTVIPLLQGIYTENDSFLPVPEWWTPPEPSSLNSKLYSALMAWYNSLSTASIKEDFAFLANFEPHNAPSEALAAAQQLMQSAAPERRAIGLAAAIQLGSDDALLRLAGEIGTVRLSPKFIRIAAALQDSYQPRGTTSTQALLQLVSLHSDAPGLDLGIVRALGRFGQTSYTPPGGAGPAVQAGLGTPTKQTLPLIVAMLDSSDPKAQFAAASLIAQFAILANPDGEIIQGVSSTHPFQSGDTLRYQPKANSDISVAEYVSFWKSWWAQNRAKLGFPAN
jgi:hypothetical protein